MMRVRRMVLAAAGAILATGTSIAAAAPASAGEPEQLKVPQGNRFVVAMQAQGVQTYQCVNAAWVFVQPDAILTRHGMPLVLHTKGPVWTSVRDGSSVTATSVANSPVPGSIPELLLKSTGNRGPGLLADVSYVQRLKTRGGAAPAGGCAEGVTTSVPYTATYTFWSPVPR